MNKEKYIKYKEYNVTNIRLKATQTNENYKHVDFSYKFRISISIVLYIQFIKYKTLKIYTNSI